ncbi:hypothetical protein F1C10_02720 [Sphingomonas sp. NBWT7]|uniref:hypothetical protein n=1 Tax=Sphingomonas sp. NBWT7 TaxID=2596913 RepID=UPI00162A77B2|nr:hypothetical protein [Sphingomonas sp. NBWT7]QNE30975.1 hypothetical protein F1C10_02720 [Sphingomonas sp. NBWT7]
MSTRISDARLLVPLVAALAACGPAKTDTKVLAKVEANQAADAVDDGRVQCAPAGADAFARVCEIERAETERGMVLTVRHPDGGFRRLLVTTDGRGVVAADGAEPAQVTLVGKDEIEVALGDDHYRLPVTTRTVAAK